MTLKLLSAPPSSDELALLRADPLLLEQELDVRPRFAEALERVLGLRAGRRYWRSRHEHLYALELGDLGRGRPSIATVFGHWDRYEPRPPEHEIDADLSELCLWLAKATGELDPEDVAMVLQFANPTTSWPEGSVLRTPEERFARVSGFEYETHTLEVEGLRMARVEAGSEDSGETFLLLHGEPTWGYLYRHMIPALAERGRVIAPDLIGFGRSDKPVAANAYSYRSHARWLRAFFDALELDDVTLVCQDWGGLLGLRLLAQRSYRFRRLVAMNTVFPDGSEPPSEAFLAWRRFAQQQSEFDVAAMMPQAVLRDDFTADEAAAYAAPFPTAEYQTGALVFPRLVPIRADQLAAWENRQLRAHLAELDIPVLLLWGEQELILAPGLPDFEQLFRNTTTELVPGASHFIQEDAGAEVARRILAWLDS